MGVLKHLRSEHLAHIKNTIASTTESMISTISRLESSLGFDEQAMTQPKRFAPAILTGAKE